MRIAVIADIHSNIFSLNEVLSDIDSRNADLMVCGHTHEPYHKMYGDKLLVNAGSAGKPRTGTPKVNYMIMDLMGDKIEVEIHEVEYEYEKTAKAIEEAGLPQEFADIVRTGKAGTIHILLP